MHIHVAMRESETRGDFFPPEVRERLESLGTVEWNGTESGYDADELKAVIPGVDILITGWGSPQVTEDVLEVADDLDLIAHTGGSVGDQVSAAVYETGIPVVSANDVMADHTAEHAFASILAKLRGIPTFDRSMHRGEWDSGAAEVRTLHGATIGLVGLGTIGRKLLDHLVSFDVTVDVYDPYVDESDLADYPFAKLTHLNGALDSEIVSLHAARTPETIGMLDADRLTQIPDGALFINTARAELVVEEALMDELQSGRFEAAIDVYHEEPLPADHELRGFDNVLLTPHVGGSQIRPPLTNAVIDDIERFATDNPLEHEIPREQWETMTR